MGFEEYPLGAAFAVVGVGFSAGVVVVSLAWYCEVEGLVEYFEGLWGVVVLPHVEVWVCGGWGCVMSLVG